MRTTLCALVALSLLVLPVAGQQLETNSAGGSLTINGQGPTGFGNPITLFSAQGLSINTSGNAGAQYSLFVSSLVPTSLPIGTESLDIDIVTATCFVDGLSLGFPALLPPVFGGLDTNGSASWSFSLNPNTVGAQFAMQAAVADPATGIGLNLTGAPEVLVVPGTLLGTVVGDDIFTYFTLNAPLQLYGFSASTIGVSTNGWITLSPSATFSDLSESSTKFLSGTIGGAPAGSGPAICALWDDLDSGNGVQGQEVLVLEGSPGNVVVQYNNMDEFPTTPIGSFVITIDNTSDTITMDYTNYTGAQTDGLVGITDGGFTGSATGVEIDIVNGGIVTPYTSTNPVESWYQDFGTGAFAQSIDLGGLSITALGGLTGFWTLF